MKFKKTLLFMASLILFGVIAGPSITANAKIITGMPRSFRHVWYHGHDKMKITKYHVFWGTKGHRYVSHITFKHVDKSGRSVTPDITGMGIESYTLAHGHMYYGYPQAHADSGTIRYHR